MKLELAGKKPVSRQVVLSLDGSTRVCSVAILTPRASQEKTAADNCHETKRSALCWEVMGRESASEGRGQARLLLVMIERLLSSAGLEPADLAAVVVGVGPGTFTGVRVAVATARAIALALNIPVVGVSSLAALAAQAALVIKEERIEARSLVTVVDAHRRQVFFAVYERAAVQPDGDCPVCWQVKTPYAACDLDTLGQFVGEGSLVVAEEARLVASLPAGTMVRIFPLGAQYLVEGQHLLAEDRVSFLRAILAEEVMGPAGAGLQPRLDKPGDPGTPESVVPIYVRPPDAEVHITKMRDPWANDSGMQRISRGR